jgi:ATP-dependent Lhr-like helicase
MQLVLHAPFGSRINRAWGLALRKKFCRLQFRAAGWRRRGGDHPLARHAALFPARRGLRYLHPNTVRETWSQAILQSPIFETRWRWSTTLSLACRGTARRAHPEPAAAHVRRGSAAGGVP